MSIDLNNIYAKYQERSDEIGRERHTERLGLVLPVRGELPCDVKSVFADFIASFLIFRIDVVEVDTHFIFLCPVETIPHPL